MKDKSQLKEGYSLYVSNLPFSVTEDQIRSVFADSGEIKFIIPHAQKGYCFIEYISSDSVQEIIRNTSTQPIVMEGRELTIEEKKPKAEKKFKDAKKPRDDRDRRGDDRDRRGDRGDRPPKPRSLNGKEDKPKPKKPFHKENITQV